MKYDVIIVGASISGLYSAYKLAKAGLQVFVVDRRSEIGTPIRCGEACGNRVEIERFLPYDLSYIAVELEGLAAHLNDEQKVDSTIEETGVILRRDKFEQFMARHAEEFGATIQLETSVKSLIKENDDTYSGILLHDGATVSAAWIIGADGAESFVGQQVGLTECIKPQDAFTSLQYRIKSTKWNNKKMHFFVGSKTIPNGYIWVFPRSETEVSVGAGLYGSSATAPKASEYLDAFIEKHYPQAPKSHLITGCAPLSVSPKRLVKENVMIVGDAARMVNPLTAGGIMTAIEAADLMGDCLLKTIKTGNRKHLQTYEKRWNFKPRLTQKLFFIMKEIFAESSDAVIEKTLGMVYKLLLKSNRSKAFSIQPLSLIQMLWLFSGTFLKKAPMLWRE